MTTSFVESCARLSVRRRSIAIRSRMAGSASAPASRRPSARTALFWHIPWPYPDRLRICPWTPELLTGLLANDLLARMLPQEKVAQLGSAWMFQRWLKRRLASEGANAG